VSPDTFGEADGPCPARRLSEHQVGTRGPGGEFEELRRPGCSPPSASIRYP
jgi:hypothetical protein